MSKLLTMLVALALFAAVPAVASAQGTPPDGDGDTISSGNTQDGEIEQDAQAGGGSGEDGDGENGHGGNAGNQACLVQQNAGRDANAACLQEQNFVDRDGDGVDDRREHHGVHSVHGAGGHGVGSVTLARTGFDAWMLALLGGVALAGGIGLLAAQRRLTS